MYSSQTNQKDVYNRGRSHQRRKRERRTMRYSDMNDVEQQRVYTCDLERIEDRSESDAVRRGGNNRRE
jgi:hypothetical protein